MGEYTLDDLVGEAAGSSSSSSSSSNESSGEWVTHIIDKLEQRGLLEALVLGPEHANMENVKQASDSGGEPATSEMGAEKVRELLLKLYDNSHLIPGLSEDPTVSELIELIEARPEQADELIKRFA